MTCENDIITTAAEPTSETELLEVNDICERAPTGSLGWICLHRDLLKWRWFQEPSTVALWIYLLLKANHEDRDWRDITVRRGQAVIGRKKTSKETGLSEQQIRTALKHLKFTGEITAEVTSRYTLITIVNYARYQDKPTPSNHQSTINQPAINQQSTTNNNITIKQEREARTRKRTSRPKFGRKRYGPTGQQWFLATPEHYAAKVKERGQAWVDYWVLRFCNWAQGEHPAASAKIRDHFMRVESWELTEHQKGLRWCEHHTSGKAGYYKAHEVDELELKLFKGVTDGAAAIFGINN